MSPTWTSATVDPGKTTTKNTSDKKKNNDNTDDDDECIEGIRFVDYVDESQLHHVMNLVGRDLSEPYSSKNTIFQLPVKERKGMNKYCAQQEKV
jgi:hypothetical protein